MTEYRIRASGEVVSESELRARHPNTSLPATLNADTLDFLGADPVLAAPQPALTEHQSAVRNGVVQDGLGNWVQAWTVRDWTADEIAAHEKAKIPREVTRRQAKQALSLSGKLAQVQPTIDAIVDPAERAMVQIWWDDALDFQREHPMIVQMGTAMGLTSADLDQLFVTAATL